MSWVDELTAPSLSARSLWRDVRADLRSYEEAGLATADRVQFLILKLVQRCSYRAGWLAGVRARKQPLETR